MALKNIVIHTQLNTGEAEKAKAFYKELFAWKLEDLSFAPNMTYTMVETGSADGSNCGIQRKTPGAPTAWLSYVQVADVKRAIAKAEKLGARIVTPYQPIPGMGAFGVFVDPTGATLGVWEPGRANARKPAKRAKR